MVMKFWRAEGYFAGRPNGGGGYVGRDHPPLGRALEEQRDGWQRQ
jgi:hypothetical protein